jgi:thioredoxin-like negative regulator of GroEL
MGKAPAVVTGVTAANGAPGSTAPNESAGSVAWVQSFEDAIEEARIEGKLVMVDFFTDWCGWCKRLDADTYANPQVAARTRGLVCVKVNAERRTDLARRYGVRAYPIVAFLKPDGSLVDMVRGYLAPRPFLAALDRLPDGSAERFVLTERLRDHPDLLDVRRDLARLLMGDGENAQALAQLDTVLSMEDRIPKTERWQIHLDHARLLLAAGRSEEARSELKGCLGEAKDSPRHAEAVYFYAEAALAQGDRKEARKYYRKLLDERPSGWLADRSRARLDAIG